MTEEARKLADELTAWVESYAKKICPEGCLPTPGQEREINMFARIAIALRSQPCTLAREEVARRDESIDPQGLLDHAMLIEAGGVPAIRAAAILREAAKIMQRFVDTRDMRRAELARLYAIEKSPSHEAGTQDANAKTVTVYIPPGYKNASDFVNDCDLEMVGTQDDLRDPCNNPECPWCNPLSSK